MSNELAHQRLLQAIDYLKDKGVIHKQQDIADTLRMGKSRISEALKGKEGKFTKGFIKSFAVAYADYINESWLSTGDGNMEKLAKNMRPHYPATVEAGVLSGDAQTVMEYEVEMEPIIKNFPNYDFMIDVSGRSMEPTYYEGDSIACRKIYNTDELTPGRVYVISTQDGAVIKRFISSTRSSLRVSSDNPEFKSYNIDFDSIISIAEVVGSIRASNNHDENIQEAIIKYAQGVLVSRINNAAITDKKRQELIDIILNKI